MSYLIAMFDCRLVKQVDCCCKCLAVVAIPLALNMYLKLVLDKRIRHDDDVMLMVLHNATKLVQHVDDVSQQQVNVIQLLKVALSDVAGYLVSMGLIKLETCLICDLIKIKMINVSH